MMKTGTIVSQDQIIPEHLQQEIQRRFPNKTFSNLAIHYYDSIEDVGYEYFVNKVSPSCNSSPTVQYLEPFISFTRLGEALILDAPESAVIYDTNNGDACTETGPFWWVIPQSDQAQ